MLEFERHKHGPSTQKFAVVGQVALKAADFATLPQTVWKKITLRPTERSQWHVAFVRYPVWSLSSTGTLREETLLLKRESQGTPDSLTNARLPPISPRSPTANASLSLSSPACKMPNPSWAWEQQLALILLASCFIAETRLDWFKEFPPHPQLTKAYQTVVLPALSMSNVCQLLPASLPLPQLSIPHAAALVVHHLDHRTPSRRSRLTRQPGL